MSAGAITLSDGLAADEIAFAIPDNLGDTRILLGAAALPAAGPAPRGSPDGVSFVWSGGGSGQWGNAAAWSADGNSGSFAPGTKDSVTITGSHNSVLSLAGNGNAARAAVHGIVALTGNFTFGTLTVGVGALDALALNQACNVVATTGTLVAGVLQVAAAGATLDFLVSATLQPGLLWVSDGGLFEAQSLMLEGGTVSLGTTGVLTLQGSSSLDGVADIGAGGLVFGYGNVRAPVSNAGVIRASGGVLAIYGPVSGSGTDQIGADSTLYLPDRIGSGQQIVFDAKAGGAVLELFGSASGCAATIIGFGVGDVIDIASGTLSQEQWTPPQAGNGVIGTLDFGAAGSLAINLDPTLDPNRVQFVLTADGLGGTAISIIACFCAGTRLACPGGTATVENVRPGDRLLTHGGAARQVRWVGQRTYGKEELKREQQLRPVRISAGCLGTGLPQRDLRLSPQHALAIPTFSGTQLLPAILLVDGDTIQRETAEAPVTYFHIELESHDLLLAEGLPVESFLTNGPERLALFHQMIGLPSVARGEACLPRLEGGYALENLRARLNLVSRAEGEGSTAKCDGVIDGAIFSARGWQVEGWAATEVSNAPVCLDLLIGSGVCGRVLANGWRPDLDRAGIRGGRCGFRTSLAGRMVKASPGPVSVRLTPVLSSLPRRPGL